MSPIEYIEEGIRNGNWETVCEGYERLTGKALPLPVTDKTEDALRQIGNIISTTLGSVEKEHEKMPKKKRPGRPKGSDKKKVAIATDEEDSSIKLDDNKRTNVQKEIGTTQLITNEPDPKEVKANQTIAAKTRRNKIKLNRKATTQHNVKCNECDKTFKSDRPKGKMGQKCPQCLKEKKSIFV